MVNLLRIHQISWRSALGNSDASFQFVPHCCTTVMFRLGKTLPVFLAVSSLLVASEPTGKRPNIVFILTDDQDVHMNSLDHMPLTQKYLINEGTSFLRHYCTGERVAFQADQCESV
jgi:hypothetical protein